MADQSLRSALLSKDKQACYKLVHSKLKGDDLVNTINDLIYISASVTHNKDIITHPVCITNSIKNFIGDNKEAPSRVLLDFALEYTLAFQFRKSDNEILEKSIKKGIANTVFVGDLENACQFGDWEKSESIMASIFLASDRSRATLDALAELCLQNTQDNALFTFHLLRAHQFQEKKSDNWVFTKCLFDKMAFHKLEDAHEPTGHTPKTVKNGNIKRGDIVLFSAIERIWNGDYVRKRGYRRELSFWLDQLIIDDDLDINIIQDHGLVNINSETFINYAEKIVKSEKTQNEKANELVTLEAVRALSKNADKQDLDIIGSRYKELLS